jgi:hypothetical protein
MRPPAEGDVVQFVRLWRAVYLNGVVGYVRCSADDRGRVEVVVQLGDDHTPVYYNLFAKPHNLKVLCRAEDLADR